ncbi:MAG: cupin domain-containing protein [Deltaproteobacteria bacterium]|nr:cupin domain-containing protein [Deltaproteobacteria bacterium]
MSDKREPPDPSLGILGLSGLSMEEQARLERELARDAKAAALARESDEALTKLAERLAPIPPPPALWDRIARSTELVKPLDVAVAPHTKHLSALLDLGESAVRAIIANLPRRAHWVQGLAPNVDLFHLAPGPALAGAACGFVRVPAGAPFPEHTHLGEELVFVVQGGCVTSDGQVARAGDELRMPAGSSHGLTAMVGADLVYLAIVREGIRIGDRELRVSDPGL